MTKRSRAERTVGLAVAVLLVTSPMVVPLLHAADGGGAVRYADREAPSASWGHHDHAVCVQLQSSSAHPAPRPRVSPPRTRSEHRPVALRSTVPARNGRFLLRARSPPARAVL